MTRAVEAHRISASGKASVLPTDLSSRDRREGTVTGISGLGRPRGVVTRMVGGRAVVIVADQVVTTTTTKLVESDYIVVSKRGNELGPGRTATPRKTMDMMDWVTTTALTVIPARTTRFGGNMARHTARLMVLLSIFI